MTIWGVPPFFLINHGLVSSGVDIRDDTNQSIGKYHNPVQESLSTKQ